MRVVWQADPAHQAVIGWDQVSGKNPVLCIQEIDAKGAASGKLREIPPTRTDQFMGMDNRFVQFTGLKPDTAYRFLVRDSEGIGTQSWFRTAPDRPKPFTFIAGGDTKSAPALREIGRHANRMVAKLRPLFVVFVGDFTSTGIRPKEWKMWLDDWAADVRSEDGRVYPIVPVRGNHEVRSDLLPRIFGLDSTNNYFAFGVGGDLFRLYTLNSELGFTGHGGHRAKTPAVFKKQTAWLRDDLARHKGVKFKAAAYHKPIRPFTKSKPDNDYLYTAWAPLFDANGMTMAFEGDSHIHKITWPIRPSKEKGNSLGFIRDDAKGTVYLGEGSWGVKIRKNNNSKPWALQNGAFNQIKWLQVFPEKILIRTVLTEKGKVDQVKANRESDVFAVPEGIALFDDGKHGTVIRLPIQPAASTR
jgi:hypothetical protein